jgi:hypothetical protein
MRMLMKTIIGFIFLLITVKQVSAQDLSTSLNEAYKTLQSATNMTDMMDANNKFNLIAAKWDKEWAANYYAAYVKAYISLKEKDAKRRDQLLDEANKYLEKVNNINASGDESLILTGYVAFARFLVDPPTRWKKYLDLMNVSLDKAKKINPENPRIYYLGGIPVFNKPKIWGGGKNKAKPYFEKAKVLFAKEDKTSILKPYWGEKENMDYLAKCNE